MSIEKGDADRTQKDADSTRKYAEETNEMQMGAER